jgi:DNA polymerase-3 subunit gamma/tau
MDQAIAYSDAKVEELTVRNMLGAIDQHFLYDLLQALNLRDGAALLRIADDMAIRSMAFDAALQDLASLLHRIALAQTVPQVISEEDPDRTRLLELVRLFNAEEIQLYYQIAIHGRNEINLAPDEYAGFTMTLLRMLSFKPAEGATLLTTTKMVTSERVAVSAGAARPQLDKMVEKVATVEVDNPVVQIPFVEEVQAVQVEPPVQLNGSLDWSVLLAQLNVQGMARELAKNCVMESFASGKISLTLAPQYKQFLSNKIAQDKLQSALSNYFMQPVKLSLSVGSPVSAVTPAAFEQQERKVRQQSAADAISQDPFVLEAKAQLDAQIIENSIKFIQ